MEIAGIGAGGLAVGIGAGLITWYLEEMIAEEIRKRPVILPLLGGAVGLTVYFVILKRQNLLY